MQNTRWNAGQKGIGRPTPNEASHRLIAKKDSLNHGKWLPMALSPEAAQSRPDREDDVPCWRLRLF
jgi:hypothetical protein